MGEPAEQLVAAAVAESEGDATALLEDVLARGRAAWPKLDVDADRFAAHVVDRVLREADPAAALAGLHAADLFLAHACGSGDAEALAAFRREYGPLLRHAFANPSAPGTDADDLQQLFFERLFSGERPRVLDYNGRGPLRAWVKVTALRLRIDRERGKPVDRQQLGSWGSRIASPELDPELDYLKRHYRAAFKTAFQAALDELSARERTMLRLRATNGASASSLAKLYRVDRATTKRWMAKARQKLLESTRARLMESLSVEDEELDSIMRLIASRLEASVCRFLGAAEGS